MLYSGQFPNGFYDRAKMQNGDKGEPIDLCRQLLMPGPRTTTYLDYAGVKAGLLRMTERLKKTGMHNAKEPKKKKHSHGALFLRDEYSRGNLFGMFWCYSSPFVGWSVAATDLFLRRHKHGPLFQP